MEPDPIESLQASVTFRQLDIYTSHYGGGDYFVHYGSNYWRTSYVENVVYQYAVVIDMDNHLFSFSINGDTILSDVSIPGSVFDQFVFARPYGNAVYAVDNFRWEIVVPPEMTSIMTAIEIGCTTQTGLTYQAQYADVVTATNWFDLGAPFVGDGSTNYVLHTTRDSTNRVYRVILLP